MTTTPTIVRLYHAAPARYPELHGKVAIVTGAGRGIGAGIAARLAKEGMHVVITGLDHDEVNAAAGALQAESGIEMLAIPGDLRDSAHVDAIIDQTVAAFKTIHVLVNNAGDLRRVRLDAVTPELLQTQMLVNLQAPMMLALKAAPIMRQHGDGSIINISSVGGLRAHLPGIPYDMTKTALDGLTRMLAVDFGEYGIRVNSIGPGAIWTKNPPLFDDQMRAKMRHYPLKRFGFPADIANAVAFLASPDASYITGHVLYVDGGLTTQISPPDIPL